MKSPLPRCLVALLLLALAGCEPGVQPPGLTQEVTAQTASEAPSGRLPEGVKPLAYRLDLMLDPRRNDFSGRVGIDIELDRPAEQIWLHGNSLRVASAVAVLPNGIEIPARYEQVLDSGVSRVAFAERLPAGAFRLEIRYEADFDRKLAGLFKVEERGDAYVLAKSESIQARKYLPGFDEPGFKATFDIRLTIPEGYQAIGNTPELNREPAGNGMEMLTFAPTRPMPTYLLSLSVGPFDVIERAAIPPNEYRSEPIPLRGFARKGRGSEMNYILDITPQVVKVFEQQLRRPYPFRKLDIVAAPQWPSGATELSAAITYREERILVGDNPSPGTRLSLLEVHAHETAHMWFGNSVTPPWWDDLWLKEGFATWSEPLALTVIEPHGGHDLNAIVAAIGAMQMDSLASTRAIREPITDNHDIRNAYDAITYSKGLGVIHMVDQYFGPERFRPALGRYVETFANGVADSADFYRVIGEETDTPELTRTFRSFVEQRGVPQLDIALACESRPQLSIRQARYKPLGSPIQESGESWTVPFCLRRDGAGGAPLCTLLTEPIQRLVLEGDCPQWLMPNASGSGYYRWNLPEAQWQALVEHFAELNPGEQLAVLDSAFAAFEAGQLQGATLLRLVHRSASAGQRQVVVAPLAPLRKYVRKYGDDETRRAFLDFARQLYTAVMQRVADDAGEEQQLLHSELLGFMALAAGDPDARRQLQERAHAFTGYGVARDEAALVTDLYDSALAVAVQDSDADFLAHLITVRGELDDPLFETASANALGFSNRQEQLPQIHQLALSEELGPRETFGLIRSALTQPDLQDQHWDWLRLHFEEVADRVPEQWRRHTPAFGSAFCEQDKLRQLQQLFARHGDLVPGYQRSLAQAEEKIQLCVAQRENGKALLRSLPQ